MNTLAYLTLNHRLAIPLALFLTAASLTGCSQAPAPSTLKPVASAFGYTLGATNFEADLHDQPLTEFPPFRVLDLDTTTDGRICSITALGTVDAGDITATKHRLIAVLAEKYGERPATLYDNPATPEHETHSFGTINRTAQLTIWDQRTNAFFKVEYYDRALQAIFFSEQNAREQEADRAKKAALKHGL